MQLNSYGKLDDLLPIEKEVLSKSVHLKLGEINILDSGTQNNNKEETDAVVDKNITISEFLCKTTNRTEVAALYTSTKSKERLEHFTKHLFHTNFSENASVIYSEVSLFGICCFFFFFSCG